MKTVIFARSSTLEAQRLDLVTKKPAVTSSDLHYPRMVKGYLCLQTGWMSTKTELWLTAWKALHFMQYHVSAVASEARLKIFRNFLPTPELPTFLSRPCRVSQLPAITDRKTLHLQPRTYYSLIEAQVSSSRSPKWITISLTPHYTEYI